MTSSSTNSSRAHGRNQNQLRPVKITRGYTVHAEGSVLIEFGDTRVLCTASVEEKVPGHKKGSGEGWVTAEYGMLPRATHTRGDREAARGKQSGRTQEIQRLIGRSMRAVFDLKKLGERTIHLDCDVLQADGGTRTASICGAFVALHDAITRIQQNGGLTVNPLHSMCAAISVGIHNGNPVLDLPYEEDSKAEVDMNVVMLQPINGGEPTYVEVQGTAEGKAFSRSELDSLLGLAAGGLEQIFAKQREVIATPPTPRPLGR